MSYPRIFSDLKTGNLKKQPIYCFIFICRTLFPNVLYCDFRQTGILNKLGSRPYPNLNGRIIFTPTTIPARVYGFRFVFFLDIILCCSCHRQLLLSLLIVFYILLFVVYQQPQTINPPGLLIHRIAVHRRLCFFLFPESQL